MSGFYLFLVGLLGGICIAMYLGIYFSHRMNEKEREKLEAYKKENKRLKQRLQELKEVEKRVKNAKYFDDPTDAVDYLNDILSRDKD